MDLNDVRIASMLVSLVLFVGLMVHTWSKKRRAEHADAQMLPFLGECVAGEGGEAQDRGAQS